MKKTPGDIIILHKCTKNHDHRLYCCWDMARDGCNCYFLFWARVFPFTPPPTLLRTVPKMKKMPGDIITLHKCTKNHDHMLYCCWDMVCDVKSFKIHLVTISWGLLKFNWLFEVRTDLAKVDSKDIKKSLYFYPFIKGG